MKKKKKQVKVFYLMLTEIQKHILSNGKMMPLDKIRYYVNQVDRMARQYPHIRYKIYWENSVVFTDFDIKSIKKMFEACPDNVRLITKDTPDE